MPQTMKRAKIKKSCVGCLITVIGITVCFLAYALLNNIRLGSKAILKYPTAVAWSHVDGIAYEEVGWKQPLIYLLPNRHGGQVYFPTFSWWNHCLVYFSPEGQALCIVNLDGSERWLALAHYFHSLDVNDESRFHMSSFPDGVYLSAADDHGHASVLQINLKINTITRIPDAIEVRSQENSSIVAMKDTVGNIDLLSSKGSRILLLKASSEFRDIAKGLWRWDYDPAIQVGVFIYYPSRLSVGRAVVINARGKMTLSEQFGYSPEDVTLQPIAHHIIVSSGTIDILGCNISCFGYNGKYLGNFLHTPYDPGSPMRIADADMKALLNHFKKGSAE